MRERSLAGPVIARLADHPDKHFADQAAWQAHLERLGITLLTVTPNPVQIATEGALWGSIQSHEFLREAVIVSDDAGQFAIGRHALCWIHAERLVHKLDSFTEAQRAAQQHVRSLIWRLYSDLKAYRTNPLPRLRRQLRARFDRIFRRRTGFATLDRLLARLHANKAELLAVLDRPDIPLHTNGSENDIRCQVTKRKVSGGTRSDVGRDCRDAFLGLAKTCAKLGIAFWDYLGKQARHIRPATNTTAADAHPLPRPASIATAARAFAPLTTDSRKALNRRPLFRRPQPPRDLRLSIRGINGSRSFQPDRASRRARSPKLCALHLGEGFCPAAGPAPAKIAHLQLFTRTKGVPGLDHQREPRQLPLPGPSSAKGVRIKRSRSTYAGSSRSASSPVARTCSQPSTLGALGTVIARNVVV
jgi:hypothetical protein